MSPENVEIVRRAIEAAIRKPKPDFDTINDLYDADHELISLVSSLDGETYRGGRGYRDYLLNDDETVQSESRLEQVTEIDADRVLVITPARFRGKASGVPLPEQRLAAIVTVRGGKIIRTQVYPSPEEALKAAGLSE
jgi:ketosteroid isomerase-like protein